MSNCVAKRVFMKYTLIALFVLCQSIEASAQRKNRKEELPVSVHHVYADIGSFPGLSLTYNYKFARRWRWGGGIQGYLSNPPYDTSDRFIPTIYGDIRFIMRPEKKNQFFSFLNLGIDFYKRDKQYYRDSISVYHFSHNNGFYTALGFGYFRRMTKRGGGLYVSLKLAFDFSTVKRYSIISEKYDGPYIYGGGDPILSLGFKF